MVRQRHPALAYQRETHTTSSINFGQPSDTLYGSQMDLEAVTVVDLGQGSVTDGAIVDGGLDGGTAIRDGTLPPSTFDTTPPPLPTGITVYSDTVAQSDGSVVVAIVVGMVPPPDEDFFATYIESTDLNDEDPVTPVPLWLRPTVTVAGKGQTSAYITGVSGATQYWVRLYSVDVMGNRSDYSIEYPVFTDSDLVAPDLPQDVSTAPGFKAIGVRWAPTSAADLMFNEVRFCRDISGSPDLGATEIRRTRGNSIYLDDLTGGVSYWVQVRSVDFSKNVVGRWLVSGVASTNVLTCVDHLFVNDQRVALDEIVGGAGLEGISPLFVRDVAGNTFKVSETVGGAAIDFTTDLSAYVGYDPIAAANYQTDPESGWTTWVGPTEAQLVGETDIAFHGIIADIITAGHIDAAQIQTGILTISTAQGTADGIKVMWNPGSGAIEVGSWDDTGLKIRSKVANRAPLDYIWLDNAGLTIYKDSFAMTGITPEGINASAVNFGTAEGGHNLVFNSSFELSKFITNLMSAMGAAGGYTFAGGVGGWVQVSNTNGTLGATAITMAAL